MRSIFNLLYQELTYHESVLKQYFKDGLNPKYNEKAARLTHIPLD